MDGRLHEAAIRGDVTSLLDLLQRDEHILDGVKVMHDPIANKNLLHVAAQFGHVDFAKEILSRKPEYAHKLNSQGQSPLHLASGAGHVEVVKLLVEKDAGACFMHDKRGMTPLHIAARKGRLEVLKELVLAQPTAAWIQTEQGEPILHLCASNGQFEALKMLIDLIPDDDFVKMKDDDDNSILHLLAPEIQTQAKWYLRAAEGGSVRAMYDTHLCYSSGEGLRSSHLQARKWLKRAADCGHSRAQYEYGLKLFLIDALISSSSKSYYACVGESIHAYQSPSKDLTAINNRLNGFLNSRKVGSRLNFDDIGLITRAIEI